METKAMMIRPIISIWILLILTVGALTFVGWRYFAEQKAYKLGWIRRGLIIAMLLLMGLRPMVPGGGAQSGNTNLDVLFVVDTTLSMVAEDYNGESTRLSGVQADIKGIIRELAGARFALIGFDNTAYIGSPFTTDSTSTLAVTDALRPIESFYGAGTRIDSPVEIINKILDSSIKKDGRKRIVFYMGDGEQTADVNPTSFAAIKDKINSGMVLGYGTEDGGRMREIGFDDSEEPVYMYYYDENYEEKHELSFIDQQNLERIASDLGVEYSHRENPDSLANKLKDIRASAESSVSDRDISTYADIYWIFAIALAGLVLWELWFTLGELAPKRRLKK